MKPIFLNKAISLEARQEIEKDLLMLMKAQYDFYDLMCAFEAEHNRGSSDEFKMSLAGVTDVLAYNDRLLRMTFSHLCGYRM